MFCKKCGTKLNDNQKFCIKCGTSFSQSTGSEENQTHHKNASSFNIKDNIGKIITVVIILAVIGFGIYNSLDDEAVETNDEAMSSYDTGDSEQAIRQFEQASEEAVTTDTKIRILKNLAYVYETDGLYDQAYDVYLEALGYASEGSFDYYLISGEIALLEGKPNAAQLSYNKAYQLDPNDFQLNNSLALFYLDLEEVAPYYADYPKALIHAQKAYDNDTEKSEVSKQNLAIAHFFNENYDRTISLLSTTNLNQHPHIAYWLGWAYVAKEDIPTAKIYFQKAVDAGVEGMEQEVYDYLNSY